MYREHCSFVFIPFCIINCVYAEHDDDSLLCRFVLLFNYIFFVLQQNSRLIKTAIKMVLKSDNKPIYDGKAFV